MTEAAVVTGWRVYRSRRSEFLDAARVRRRTLVCGLVAAVLGTVGVVAQLLWPSVFEAPLALALVAIVAFAAAVGCLVATFLRTASTPATLEPAALTGDWRRSERIGEQFGPRPPAMLPEDRDEVLGRAEASTGAGVVVFDRTRWLPVGWLVAWVGLLVIGQASAEHLVVLLMPPVLALMQSSSAVTALLALGRADTARRRAEAMPPYDPPPAAPTRNRDPRGSKLGLPGA
jgi:hypothetical protein